MNFKPLSKLTAFSKEKDGGNPAGVWVGSSLPSVDFMQTTAREVGFSETVFLAPLERSSWKTRYFSPEIEVTFCGHATIAAGVVLGEKFGEGSYRLCTAVGEIPVQVTSQDGLFRAAFISVSPAQRPVSETLVNQALKALGWALEDLDPSLPPIRAYAGAWHLILGTKTRSRLQKLNYDFEELKKLMLRENLTTLQMV